MKKNLLIVFTKNIELGKVKTRLAKTIGNQAALDIYKGIVQVTEKEVNKMTSDVWIFYSDKIDNEGWGNAKRFVQQGEDLGERMKNAFIKGFDAGYERIVLIGTDLPEITSIIMEEGLEKLKRQEVVFGPAEDGGYYLVGLTNLNNSVFDDKPWSTEQLLKLTLAELEEQDMTYSLLQEMNDIDTIQDLEKSSFYKEFKILIDG